MFNKFPWFYNYSASGVISAPPRAVFGQFYVTGAVADPRTNTCFVLTVVLVLALAAKGLVGGRVGRAWMAIRIWTSPPRSSVSARCGQSCSLSH